MIGLDRISGRAALHLHRCKDCGKDRICSAVPCAYRATTWEEEWTCRCIAAEGAEEREIEAMNSALAGA
jgi:hypothetical protein